MMLDIHAHVLPGVDDGAVSLEMSRAMMKCAVDVGVKNLITTSHVYRPGDQTRNLSVWENTATEAHAIGLTLHVGCEFNYRMLMHTGTQGLGQYCLAGTPCILLEFSNDSLMPGWENVLCDLTGKGYLPIIAHPERYFYVQKDMGIAREMMDYGCELQVDAGGLLAGPWSAEQKTARKLLERGMASYIASDAHRPEQYTVYGKVFRKFRDEWPSDNRLESFLKNKKVRRRRNPLREREI